MKSAQTQLIETFKILTFDFANSVHKMASLNGETLQHSKEVIFSKILDLLQFGRSHYTFEDIAKMLENGYEDVRIFQVKDIKHQCFEKDLSISINNSSQPKDMHSDLESDMNFHHRKESFDDSTEKIKKEILSHQRSAEITKYSGDPSEIFQYVDSFSIECKKEEQTPISKMEFSGQIQESFQESDIFGNDEEEIEEMKDDENDSSFSIEDYSESDDQKEDQMMRGKNQTPSTRSTFTSTIKKKKYRSYTEEERQKAIKYATEMGFDFTSKTLDIPKKNICRWVKRKDKAERSRGRKPGDPAMEQNLTNWIKANIGQGRYLTQTEIRIKAREFAGSKGFKASKGWLEKYFRRNSLIGEALNSLLYVKRLTACKSEYINLR